jgi:hypothetical protein
VQTKWNSTEARRRWADLLDAAQQGQWQQISASHRRQVLVTSKAELSGLLAHFCPFAPEVLQEEDGSLAIWLPELDVFGQGHTLTEAAEDLVDSVREYVDDWDDLRDAPNHRDRVWHVRRLQLADDNEELCRMLFGEEVAADLCAHLCPA